MFYVMCVSEKTWNTPGSEGDSSRLCYLDKVAGGRSTLVLIFKSKIKREFQWRAFKDVSDILFWNCAA